MQAEPEGRGEGMRARHLDPKPPPELERAILSIRRRLRAHAAPATRYCLTGATAIRAELKALGIRPPPCERTVECVLQRHGLTAPRVRERVLGANITWLYRFTLSILKQHPDRRMSLAMKRRGCGWSETFLMEIINVLVC